MAGQGEAADLSGAAVQYVKQHALTPLDADGFTVAEHASVDGERAIANLIAVRHAFGQRGFHGGFALVFELLHLGGGGKEILRHVTTAAECGLKLFEGEEDFAIIVAGLIFGLDVDRSDFAAISAAIKIGSGTNVRVIEAEPGRTGREGNAAAAMRGNEGR